MTTGPGGPPGRRRRRPPPATRGRRRCGFRGYCRRSCLGRRRGGRRGGAGGTGGRRRGGQEGRWGRRSRGPGRILRQSWRTSATAAGPWSRASRACCSMVRPRMRGWRDSRCWLSQSRWRSRSVGAREVARTSPSASKVLAPSHMRRRSPPKNQAATSGSMRRAMAAVSWPATTRNELATSGPSPASRKTRWARRSSHTRAGSDANGLHGQRTIWSTKSGASTSA